MIPSISRKNLKKVKNLLNEDKVEKNRKRLTSFLWKQNRKNFQSRVTYDQT